MSGIPGTNVAAMVVPFDDLDIYATHNDKYGRGGFRVHDTLVERDAISELRRKEGMWVKVVETGKVYELQADLLTWAEVTFSAESSDVVVEAGEDLDAGVPVKVVTNKAYAASHLTDPLVIGLTKSGALLGFSVTIVTAGRMTLSGLTPGAPYFLGNGVTTTSAPTSGYVTRVGSAVSATTLLVNIEEPILLS